MSDRLEIRRTENNASIVQHIAGGDVEFAIGALASRHGLTLDQARSIIEECGADADCLDDRARELAARH